MAVARLVQERGCGEKVIDLLRGEYQCASLVPIWTILYSLVSTMPSLWATVLDAKGLTVTMVIIPSLLSLFVWKTGQINSCWVFFSCFCIQLQYTS